MVLVAFGFAAVYSVALSQYTGEFLSVKKQAVAFFVGIVVFSILLFTNYRVLRSFSLHLYIISILLLVFVLLFGDTIRGTTGWFRIGVFSFQPVEFAKLALILALAKFFSERRNKSLTWTDIAKSGLIVLCPSALVLAQPDLGSAFLLIGLWLLLLLFFGVSKRQAITLSLVGAASLLVGWFFIFADYQKARLLSFLNPEMDPLGQGYNVLQSVIAIGSGQLFGRGLGFGSQSQLRFLPEAHTDFVLAVIAEELGFVGLLLVFTAFAIMFWRLGRLMILVKDGFTTYLILGVAVTIFLQFIVNAGMNLGLMPVTGITLPFVSYGGSSLIFFIIMIGIVESVSLRMSVFSQNDG